MRIYCAGSMRGDISYRPYFRRIVEFIEELGHSALSELSPSVLSEVTPNNTADTQNDRGIYERDMEWLNSADALIAEVSGHSCGVGYEISYALHVLEIPVLCLKHRYVKKLSAMINGNTSELLTLKEYEDDRELESAVLRFVEDLQVQDEQKPR